MNHTLKVNSPLFVRVKVKHCIKLFAILSALTAGLAMNGRAQDGFCMVNGTTTGGAGGPTVTVSNGTDFNTQINMNGPRIIQVQGPISIGRIFTKADKTIIGLGTNATLLGNLNISDTSNVIVRNLRITSPGRDGLTIWNSQHVWVDHCTFYDTGDGACDMNRGSQYVTVSWCKFIYPTQEEHRFTMIADGYDNGGTITYGYYTLHHNWWSTGSGSRMPASSYGRIHMYNNYFNCTNNGYCSNARCETEFLSENNFYSGVKNPIYKECTGKIKTAGNVYVGTYGKTPDAGTDSVFTPSYAYTLDATVNVPTIVMGGAGAPGPDTIPIPPKVWDGGGGNNNLTTANNWALNENPKEYDTLLFAGSARLAPYNNHSDNTEFSTLAFSNNAGAFVLGGNTLSFGKAISDDSPSVQTLNLDLDFTYAVDHYAMSREFSVTDPDGVLVINGSVVGVANTYNKLYTVTKSGPGILALNGANGFPGAFAFDGGLVRFNNAGNLGTSSLAFDGGGLQWATGNTTDISINSVSIGGGGVTFDMGANNVTFANPLGGAGGLTKTGPGKLTLNGNNTFNGSTVIALGTLAFGSAGSLPSTSNIILSNNAALDVSGRSDGTLTLASGKTLLGIGSVLGNVTAANGSTISPGFSIGELVVTDTLTFQSGSTAVMELDAAAHTNDVITGLAGVSYGGHLMLGNLTSTLLAGDNFKLFSAGSYSGSFSSIVWPSLSGSLYWTNRLAVDGTIAVVSPVDTTPTNLAYLVTNDTLILAWPEGHTGWRLEGQTNNAGVGLGTNWTSLGYETTNAASFPVDLTDGSVFYRLVYP